MNFQVGFISPEVAVFVIENQKGRTVPHHRSKVVAPG